MHPGSGYGAKGQEFQYFDFFNPKMINHCCGCTADPDPGSQTNAYPWDPDPGQTSKLKSQKVECLHEKYKRRL
jgi:hypothetical protein